MKQTDIECLIRLHGKKVYNFCLRLCAGTYDADDLYQDTFLKAMEKISYIDENNNPSAYLCAIAFSLYKSKMRKLSRRHAIAPTFPIEGSLTQPQTDSLEDRVTDKELYREIRSSVDLLDEKLRICVLLHYINDMSLQEIAKALEIPEGTVKSRLFTARNILKEKFGKGEVV